MSDPKQIVNDFWDRMNLCGCHDPAAVLRIIHGALLYHQPSGPDFDGGPSLALFDDTLTVFVLYVLDSWGLTEHGGSIAGAWLTDEGVKLRDALGQVDLATVLDS